jgi:uncharacterized 2Fe-2S/4Fe-4S cluster protein (DUF4445 family)
MGTLSVLGTAKTTEVREGTLLTVALKQAGINLETPCGGKGACGRCLVRIVSGSVDTDSLGLLSAEAIKDGFVLACKTRLQSESVTVLIPGHMTGEMAAGKFSDSKDDLSLVDPLLFPDSAQIQNPVSTLTLSVEPPREGDGLSDLDRFRNALTRMGVTAPLYLSRELLVKLPDVVRARQGRCTVSYISKEPFQALDIAAAGSSGNWYGIAIDLGTTTIALQLVDLKTGTILETVSDYNMQITHGSDVISRINYARKVSGLKELRKTAVESINQCIKRLLEPFNLQPSAVALVRLSGNTTMVHLLLGIPPENIRTAPYTPAVLSVPDLNARELGLMVNHHALLGFSPAVGSYIGGDITAGILCSRLATDADDLSLFIDIGTNGELVVGNNEFLLGCACSAGPAFEGGGIGCGMRAATGAIEGVEINPEDGTCSWWTIGNTPPKGICGSGIIALMANLFITGWLDAAGKFTREKKTSAIRVNGRRAEYVLVPADKTASGKEMVITEQDIENIIRTKAAIFSAITIVLKKIDLDVSALSRIYIAGGFGRFLSIEHAKTIGLIPDLPDERFHFIGNSSLTGSYMTLISPPHRALQETLAKKITYIDLMNDPGYMDNYTAALFIPHTDKQLFPSVKGLERITFNRELRTI